MKQLVILGAGTAGTIMANHLRRKLNLAEWQLTVVDQDPRHYYQPGFLFMPFGMLDFNYRLEPVPGQFPFPGLGPFNLLGESRINHWGKMAFKWIYWHVLLRAWPIPFVSHNMTLAGKRIPAGALKPEHAV